VASSLAAMALVGGIRAYQAVLAPLFRGACRFEPTCSHYGVAAITTHGALRGTWLTARRIARCHPFGGAGFDPVPPAHRPH
jgi:putative membrane protein insertion efficiency factor